MHNFRRTYCFLFSQNIPNYIDIYLKQKSLYRRYLKFIKRYIFIFLKGQMGIEVYKILPAHKKILWINISAPSLGDSLMDLSSRVMLQDRFVDLFTDQKNAHIFRDDLFFKSIFTSSTAINETQYDLVIIDSYSTRSIQIKSMIAPKTSYVGMFGYFNGPEVNRILFSFYHMNFLLGSVKSEHEINLIANNFITISKKDKEIVNNIVSERFIAFVLGGEWNYKTYNKWDEVIRKIVEADNQLQIIFLGSKNAKKISEEILSIFPKNNILNFVDKLSFNQSVEIARRSKVLFCCDGGLMHAANAVNSINITLFARLTPEMLLTKNVNSYSIYDEEDVNNIPSEEVLSKYCKII
jgi:ADP-heptose:LPS heptosyltransferase